MVEVPDDQLYLGERIDGHGPTGDPPLLDAHEPFPPTEVPR